MSESRGTLRSFGLILGSLLLAFGAYRQWPPTEGLALGLVIAGGVFLLLSLVFPRALGPIYGPWMWVGRILGRINAVVILTILFGLVFTPMGLLLRLFRWDPLGLRPDAKTSSYWVKRRPLEDPAAELERLY